MYAEERADIHDFLAALSSEQWAVPSLCAGWEVKDVAVHLLVDEPLRQLGAPRVLIMAAQCRFSVRATDMDWSWGHGPEVSGPAESILMALAGRPVAIADLEGEGMAALASRVEAPPPAAAPTVIKPTTNGAP
jgi:hypothetical protein